MFKATSFKIHRSQGFEYIYVSQNEKTENNIVLLHGMFGGLSNFDAIIPQLENVNVYVPCIPIYDYSISKLSIESLTEWLHNFITSLDITNPILLGNSMGGHIALDYAITYPDNIKALVLAGSSGIQEKNFGESYPRRKDREYIREQASVIFYEDLVDEEIMDEIMEVVKSPSKLLKMLALARDTNEYNMEPHLPDIPVPVLLIWGRNDEVTPPAAAKKFQKKLPNARLEWIDKCGHAPMMEHPKKFAFLLNEFLLDVTTDNFKSNNYQL